MTKKEIITALNDSESRIAFIFDALDKGILLNDIEVYLLELREMQTKIVDIQNFIVCISLKTKGRVEKTLWTEGSVDDRPQEEPCF